MSARRAVLLVGSPRGIERSTSGRLGGKVLEALAAQGLVTERVHVHAALRLPEDLERALDTALRADLVILSAPLYVDSLPAPVIAFLERVAERRAPPETSPAARVHFSAILQCGFPEEEQNDTALAIAERFAAEVGWQWLGGLSLGGLETYGASLDDALRVVAAALAMGEPVPRVPLRKTMPPWLYRLGGNAMWRRTAKKNRVARKLRDRPYAE